MGGRWKSERWGGGGGWECILCLRKLGEFPRGVGAWGWAPRFGPGPTWLWLFLVLGETECPGLAELWPLGLPGAVWEGARFP